MKLRTRVARGREELDRGKEWVKLRTRVVRGREELDRGEGMGVYGLDQNALCACIKFSITK